MDRFYDELLVELECPVCLTYMAPPIRQCVTGHSLCETCRKKLQVCPLCQGRFTDTKNISLEALARKMHYPCIHAKSGCMVRLNLNERDNHERICPHKGYKCFYSKCSWQGRYDDILEHWNQKKLSSKPYNNNNVCHTKIVKTDIYFVNIIQAYGEIFWYKFKISGGKIFWTVQYIGPIEKANDFYFEIELFKPRQPVRKILMSEFCQPVDLDGNNIFNAGTCVMTTVESINHFFEKDQSFIYYMRVKPVSEFDQRGPRDRSTSIGSQSSLNQDCGRRNGAQDFGRRFEGQNFGHRNEGQDSGRRDEASNASRRPNFRGCNRRPGPNKHNK